MMGASATTMGATMGASVSAVPRSAQERRSDLLGAYFDPQAIARRTADSQPQGRGEIDASFLATLEEEPAALGTRQGGKKRRPVTVVASAVHAQCSSSIAAQAPEYDLLKEHTCLSYGGLIVSEPPRRLPSLEPGRMARRTRVGAQVRKVRGHVGVSGTASATVGALTTSDQIDSVESAAGALPAEPHTLPKINERRPRPAKLRGGGARRTGTQGGDSAVF